MTDVICFDVCADLLERGSASHLRVQPTLINVRQEPSEMDTHRRFQKVYGILRNLVHLDGENIFKGICWS